MYVFKNQEAPGGQVALIQFPMLILVTSYTYNPYQHGV